MDTNEVHKLLYVEIGEWMRHQRRVRKLTLDEAANHIKCSPKLLGAVERGEKALPMKFLTPLIELYQVRPDSLIEKLLELSLPPKKP